MSGSRNINAISFARREWLFQRQGGKCCWCGKTMLLGAHSKRAVTEEHLVKRQTSRRKKRRGQDWHDDARFVLLACFKCNTGRRSEAPQEALDLAAAYFAEWDASTEITR